MRPPIETQLQSVVQTVSGPASFIVAPGRKKKQEAKPQEAAQTRLRQEVWDKTTNFNVQMDVGLEIPGSRDNIVSGFSCFSA